MRQFIPNNNEFTGILPGNYDRTDCCKLWKSRTITAIDKDICDMAVWDKGELVNLKMECNTCR